ncbi:hypothetical protein SAMN04488104_1005117 [Algoriphagus faecimaris]|uniref:Uncharacterized protein n=1 Tax=Algoriphagus faecimaris TaxID=686796 RepID=A0A1G6P8X8_9BACT|nr:hypothetical protein [Algoriphagus faecimaris]SDC76692.1 hypothetical protein SAMN04488104_1005117 [Algoriphagus faecimaris]
MRKFIFSWGLCMVLTVSSIAQTVNDNLANLDRYQEELPFFQELITGAQYPEPPRKYDGFPFLDSRTFTEGGLTINRVFYPNVPLLYDIRFDQVVTFHPLFSQKLLINPSKIDAFVLGEDREFIQLKGNEGYYYNRNSFYELIEEGDNYRLLSKHYKEEKPTREIGEYVGYYVEYEDFFLEKEGRFFPMKKKKDAIKLLQVEKKAVREHLIRQGVYFNQSPREFLAKLLQLASQSNSSHEEN